MIAGSTNLNSIVRMVNTIAHGGELEKTGPEQQKPAPPKPGAAAESGPRALPINPDAREAEGVEAVLPRQVPKPPSEQSGGAARAPAEATGAGAADRP